MQNIGKMRNRGVEVGINAGIISNRDINWTAYANMTFNQNRVLELATDEPLEGAWSIVEPGHPVTQFYMKEWAGVDATNGKPLWYLNEEGDETTSDYNAAAKRYVGAAEPKVLGGFGTNFRWKGFDASLAFNYRMGGKVFDTGAKFTGWGMAGRTPLVTVAENSWTPENPNAYLPLYTGYFAPFYKGRVNANTRYLQDASYIRLKSVQIGYNIPEKITRKAGLQKVSVFVAGENLWTWSPMQKYTRDFDVVTVCYGSDSDLGGGQGDGYNYPTMRTFSFGVNIGF